MDESLIGVIDIGSNTIKLSLIKGLRNLKLVYQSTERLRISSGMHENDMMISPAAIEGAAQCVRRFRDEADAHAPRLVTAVGTSAIREAANQTAVLERIAEVSGLTVRVLSGFEEASLIGRAVGTDPLLRDLGGTLSMMDIGGGSMELVQMRNNELVQAVSLPVGAVVMTERFIKNPAEVISYDDTEDIFEYVSVQVRESEFNFEGIPFPLIGTGGAFIAVRSVLAARKQQALAVSDTLLSCEEIGELLTALCMSSGEGRAGIEGLAADRVDILPAALATVLSVAEITGVDHFLHSFHNLPFGLAAEALDL